MATAPAEFSCSSGWSAANATTDAPREKPMVMTGVFSASPKAMSRERVHCLEPACGIACADQVPTTHHLFEDVRRAEARERVTLLGEMPEYRGTRARPAVISRDEHRQVARMPVEKRMHQYHRDGVMR